MQNKNTQLETETYLQNLQLKIDAMLRNDEGMINLIDTIEEKKLNTLQS